MDKKTAAVVFVTVLCFGAITAGAVFMFMKPSGEDAVKTPGVAFPTSRKGIAVASNRAPAQVIPAPADWGKKPASRPPVRGASPGKSGGGSLGFIKKDKSFLPEESKESPGTDPKAIVEGLRQARESESGSLSDKAIRAIMQKVVDGVKSRQPRWYDQFLANKNLKAIADRYDKDNNFETFVRLLAKSTSFKSMLKLKSKRPELKELTWSLLGDDSIGPSVKQILTEKRDDPNLIGLLKNYGEGAGVPADLLEAAGVMLKQQKPTKKSTAKRPRPRLQKRDFGGYSKPAQAPGPGAQPAASEMPAGVTPEMVEKYKKYMKK